MYGRFIRGAAWVAALAIGLAPTVPGTADLAAQDASGRFRVLVPDFQPQEGADRGFGEDAANRLRNLMQELPRHTSIDRGEIRDNLRRFEVRMEDLNCTTSRQLGSQMNAQIVVCGTYAPTGQDREVRVEASIWDLGANQSYPVEPFTISSREDRQAAQQVLASFEGFVEQQQRRDYCFQYAESKQWDDALNNCRQALDMNPADLGVRQQIGRIYYEQAQPETEGGQWDQGLLAQALEQYQAVIEEDPLNDTALNTAAYIATQLGQKDVGRDLYNQYLELNPGDIAVRRTIAYDLFQAGDPEGAMLMIEQGLDVEDNPDLRMDIGNYAFAAAATMEQDTALSQAGDDDGLAPQVADLYSKAIDAYMIAFEAKGDSMAAGPLRNVINAHLQLGETEEALAAADRILEIHQDDASIWMAYSTALQRADRTDEAVEALQRVGEIDPDYANLYAQRGRLLLEQGRLQEAVDVLQEAIDRGEQTPTAMANLVFAKAHPIGQNQKNFDLAMRYLEAAKSFDVSGQARQQLDFWHGYFLFQQAAAQQEPNTLETARATLPKFQRAKSLVQAGSEYASSLVDMNQLISNMDQFIEIQNAIIERGR